MHWLRSQGRRAISQEEPAKPRKLQDDNPRQTRAVWSETGNAPATKTITPLPDIFAWEEPSTERVRPSWADADSISSKENKYLRTMKPIGQYPSPAEYKSVGLTPPPKHVLKRTKLATRNEGDHPIVGMPITPVAEATMGTMGTHVDNDQVITGIERSITLNGSIECIVGETIGEPIEDTILNGDIDVDALTTNLATPISEAPDTSTLPTSTLHPSSYSPAATPLGTPVHEILTDPVLIDPESHLTAPNADTPLPQTQSPPATAVTDSMAPQKGKTAGHNYLAVLHSLPAPTSSKYDVQQLKQVVESAILDSAERGDNDVALSLVYYWSGISDDDFKMALIHNIGRNVTDHTLELALMTVMRHSIDDATDWYKSYSAGRGMTLTWPHSDSDISSAKSLEAEPLGRTSFKVSDIYRDTSGPKLEEAFVSGKTNTAPLKRPKKPVPVNEKSFKRRREWEADPSLEDTLQKKRARFSKDTAAEVDQVIPDSSSVRPKRGAPDEIEHPNPKKMARAGQVERAARVERATRQLSHYTLRAADTRIDEDEISESELLPAVRPASDLSTQRSIGELRRQTELRTQRAIKERQKEKEKGKRLQKVKDRRPKGKGRARSPSVYSDLSDSCYSVRINDWNAGYPPRLMPDQMYVIVLILLLMSRC